MKALSKYILGAAALLTLAACDSVNEDDRYIELPGIEANKAVLLADFTGQQCSNCPLAHASIEKLQEQYGDLFIPVSIHAGKQSISIDNTRYVGLATPTGEQYDAYFGIGPLGYPSVDVDFSKSLVFGSAATSLTWVDEVRNALQKEALVDIHCAAIYTPGADGDGEIAINTTLLGGGPATKAKLMLWIVEDGIVSIQMGDGIEFPARDLNYVHNNVFRAAANGTWGEDVALEYGVETVIEPTIFSITTDWQKTWVPANLSIVAFVYTDADGVLQATRVKVH